MQTKVSDLRQRLAKKDQEREKEKEREREELSRIARQKEDLPKPLRAFNEKPPQISKDLITDLEKKKINTYFRYKIFALSKLIEDKVRNNGLIGKGAKVLKMKPNNTLLLSNTTSVNKNPANNDAALVEEVWKLLKAVVSTKSRYKYRDITHYHKKVREAIKNLLPVDSPKLKKGQMSALSINLEDESPAKGPTKKSKPQEEDRASAIAEFMAKRKENPAAKVFIAVGGYSALREALTQRGWIENPDPSSKDFALKWCPGVDIKYDSIKANQYVNHFEKNTLLTTKMGLSRSMKNLIWYENEDIDEYYPRCYDLNDIGDFDDFMEDFKFEQAIATLRQAKGRKDEPNSPDYNAFKLRLCIALSICERRLKPFDMIVFDSVKNENSLFTQEEWELINVEDMATMDYNKYEKTIRSIKRRYGIEFGTEANLDGDKSIFIQAEGVLARLESQFPQFSMNQGNNIWIVKPAGLSRGRGIACHNSLPNLLDHIKIKESEWVAQKYIENPLIIKSRKFDIRQWVVVTDWSPLTVWFYEECYIRFSAHDFNPDDVNNKFSHLTNNAIGRNAENFETSEIEGNMWDSNEFRAYLQETTGKDTFEESIKKQMKNIVIKSLQSAQEMQDSPKNAFELFGYDFMIDENHKAWLIEINSSPSMDYSTKITERLVKQALGDCMKVVVDLGMSKKSRKNVDTGNFSCIYAGKTL